MAFEISQAATPDNSQTCTSQNNLSTYKAAAYDSANLMAFANDGGILNLGTCWWHSRLQQAALYLARFSPSSPKPSLTEARKMIAMLATLRTVVVIPGYSNWREFSHAWQMQIQEKLNAWQIQEGVWGFSWITGLSGESQLPPEKLRAEIESIRGDVEILNRISYTRLQLPGIESHSLLVVGVEPTKNGKGYILHVIDSNRPHQITKVFYTFEMMTVYGGVLYLERRQDFRHIATALKNSCSAKTSQSQFMNLTEEQLDQMIFESLLEKP